MPTDREHWTLDRKVPAAIVATILIQLFGFAWYAAKLDARVEEQALRLNRAETQITSDEREAREVSTRLVRVEEKVSAILDILRRLEREADGRNGNQQ